MCSQWIAPPPTPRQDDLSKFHQWQQQQQQRSDTVIAVVSRHYTYTHVLTTLIQFLCPELIMRRCKRLKQSLILVVFTAVILLHVLRDVNQVKLVKLNRLWTNQSGVTMPSQQLHCRKVISISVRS